MDKDFEIALTSSDKRVAMSALLRLVETNSLTELNARLLRTDAKTRGVRKKASVFLREPSVEMERLLNVCGFIVTIIALISLLYFGWSKVQKIIDRKVAIVPATIQRSDINTSSTDSTNSTQTQPQYKFKCTVVKHKPFTSHTSITEDEVCSADGVGYIDLNLKNSNVAKMKISMSNSSEIIALDNGELLSTGADDKIFMVQGKWSKCDSGGEILDSGAYTMLVTKDTAEAKLFHTTKKIRKYVYTITMS